MSLVTSHRCPVIPFTYLQNLRLTHENFVEENLSLCCQGSGWYR